MDTDSFRQMLLDRREALQELSRISAGSRSAVELDQTKVGRVSRIDAMQQQEMAKATEAQRAGELKKIGAALERLESGDYGYCIDCDEEIAPKRLEIDPATALCIDCAGR